MDESFPEVRTLDSVRYPSSNIAFQAADMITLILEHLMREGELGRTPAFTYVLILNIPSRTIHHTCADPRFSPDSARTPSCPHCSHTYAALAPPQPPSLRKLKDALTSV